MTPDMLAEKKFKDISDRVSGIIADRKEMVTDYTAANEEFKDCCKRRKDLFMSAYEQLEPPILHDRRSSSFSSYQSRCIDDKMN